MWYFKNFLAFFFLAMFVGQMGWQRKRADRVFAREMRLHP
jgi:hypothetical protein